MFEITEYIGIIAFSMSGFFVAVRSKLDFLGVLISVFLTAFGGGIVRDIIVGKLPYTFSHDLPAMIVFLLMCLLIIMRLHKKPSIENKPWFIVSDSIGLVSFSITGALVALEYGLNFTGVLVLSFITAVGGGIVRDVIINEVPFVFKTGFYGTVSLLVGACMYASKYFGFMGISSTSVLFFLAVALRIVAYYKKWSVPLV